MLDTLLLRTTTTDPALLRPATARSYAPKDFGNRDAQTVTGGTLAASSARARERDREKRRKARGSAGWVDACDDGERRGEERKSGRREGDRIYLSRGRDGHQAVCLWIFTSVRLAT